MGGQGLVARQSLLPSWCQHLFSLVFLTDVLGDWGVGLLLPEDDKAAAFVR